MGIFDKKLRKPGDDFDSPVEEVNLSTAATKPSAPAGSAKSRGRAAERTAEQDHESVDYGINRAIELMRQLPSDNVELVVRVVKTTLESTHVNVGTIIKDATRKQADIEGRIEVLRKEIGELETEIATRRSEISSLESDHKETTMVKDRLTLAEKLDRPTGAVGGREDAPEPPRRPGTNPPRSGPPGPPPLSGIPSGPLAGEGSGALGSKK